MYICIYAYCIHVCIHPQATSGLKCFNCNHRLAAHTHKWLDCLGPGSGLGCHTTTVLTCGCCTKTWWQHQNKKKTKQNNARRSQSNFVQVWLCLWGVIWLALSKHSTPSLFHSQVKRCSQRSTYLCHLISLASHFSFSLWNVLLEVSSSPLQPAFVHAAPDWKAKSGHLWVKVCSTHCMTEHSVGAGFQTTWRSERKTNAEMTMQFKMQVQEPLNHGLKHKTTTKLPGFFRTRNHKTGPTRSAIVRPWCKHCRHESCIA